jgi:putative transposase
VQNDDRTFVRLASGTVTQEEVYLRAYGSVSKARTAIGRYLTFYNERRPRSSLDHRTPDHVYCSRPLLAAA